jgi:phosphoribosylformimino-5-aminoimidazole carboxamide ribonucleotide (ProFAR) isomerase
MHKEMLYNRAAVLVTKYIESYEIRVEVGGGIKIMYDRMRNMQDRMRI